LMMSGIREIIIVCNPGDDSAYSRLLGNGEELGITISYIVQEKPRGIGEGFILAKDDIGCDSVCLVLGDNLFYGPGLRPKLESASSIKLGARIFSYLVNDPERFGVVEFDENNLAVSLEEKPKYPKSSFAVAGLYYYDNQVVDIAASIEPSARAEIEITDINKVYLSQNSLLVEPLGRGYAWLDMGTHESLLEASDFIATVERRQGFKVACIEEIALNNGWIDFEYIEKASRNYGSTDYSRYLKSLLQ
jgi:glucose-1-phosphate thymidylyltransferase